MYKGVEISVNLLSNDLEKEYNFNQMEFVVISHLVLIAIFCLSEVVFKIKVQYELFSQIYKYCSMKIIRIEPKLFR